MPFKVFEVIFKRLARLILIWMQLLAKKSNQNRNLYSLIDILHPRFSLLASSSSSSFLSVFSSLFKTHMLWKRNEKDQPSRQANHLYCCSTFILNLSFFLLLSGRYSSSSFFLTKYYYIIKHLFFFSFHVND